MGFNSAFKGLISPRNWNCACANWSHQETIFHVLTRLVSVQTVLL